MSRITLKNFPVTPQTLLTTENLCLKQKYNFYEKVLPPSITATLTMTSIKWLFIGAAVFPVHVVTSTTVRFGTPLGSCHGTMSIFYFAILFKDAGVVSKPPSPEPTLRMSLTCFPTGLQGSKASF